MPSRRKHDSEVPQDSVALATLGMNVAAHLGLLEGSRHEMINVPELPDATVAEALENAGARFAPIGRENGLPHGKHADGALWVSLENARDCGGPPQTHGSSRRE